MGNKYGSIGWGLAVTGSLIAVNELNNFDNYLKLQSFIVKFGLIGLAIATIVIVSLQRKNSNVEKTNKLNWNIIFLFVFGLVVLTISIGSKLNRHFSNENPRCDSFEIIVKDSEKRRRTKRYFIQATSSNEFKEVTIKEDEWVKIKLNEEIKICDYKGLFGYEFSKLETR